jgi:colanic acid/amylovoran biosynthesis glycosyltransferase
VTTVAYLANQFPSAVEPYVEDEIQELRRRGARVIAGSVRRQKKPVSDWRNGDSPSPILFLQPLKPIVLMQALVLGVRRWRSIADLVRRVVIQGRESPVRRIKALLHTWLGAYYAVLLKERKVEHVHVHHGYFGSWVGLVAARLLGVTYSLTLHGSDLLLHGAYLDKKLERCRFCATISQFNRRHILRNFPYVEAEKVAVMRLGVAVPSTIDLPRARSPGAGRPLKLLSVGRLNAVKDHAFLIRACAKLRDAGAHFTCAIAGDGQERTRLEKLISRYRLRDRMKLLGHVARSEIGTLYREADIVVLTSRSEGIPLVLMEAMAHGKLLLAPAITGIPELVCPGKSGFLYAAGAMDDFVQKLLLLRSLMVEETYLAVSRLDWVRHAARVQVVHNFNRAESLTRFSDCFLQRIAIP